MFFSFMVKIQNILFIRISYRNTDEVYKFIGDRKKRK